MRISWGGLDVTHFEGGRPEKSPNEGGGGRAKNHKLLLPGTERRHFLGGGGGRWKPICRLTLPNFSVGKPIALGLFWTEPCSSTFDASFADWGSKCQLRKIIGGGGGHTHPLTLATALLASIANLMSRIKLPLPFYEIIVLSVNIFVLFSPTLTFFPCGPNGPRNLKIDGRTTNLPCKRFSW